MVVAFPFRLNVAPVAMFSPSMPVVVPVRLTVPWLMRFPESTPERFATAPALLTRPAFSAPVVASVPLLITAPVTVPALVKVASLRTSPAITPPDASASVPALTWVCPV